MNNIIGARSYTLIKRNASAPSLQVFDVRLIELTGRRRNISNTPFAGLSL